MIVLGFHHLDILEAFYICTIQIMIFRTQDRSWCDVVGDMFDYYEADSSGQLFSNTEILDSAFAVGVS